MARAHIAPSKTSTGAADAIAPSTARGSQPASACDILVIEDDLGIADVLRLALQSEGHTVDVAADGDEGLTYLQQRHYRLLLLDLLLPGLDGMGVLRALREEPARRPPVVIILSALQGRADVVRALEAGADDYLTNPFDVDDFVLRVNLWLRRVGPVTVGGILELRRIAAERARQLVTEQERSRRLTELAVLKADFTAMATHELGSPLAAIRGFLDMLATGELNPFEESQALATIRTETAMLTALVADVQAAATVERDDFAVQPRPVSVALLLADAIAVARALPGAHPLTTTIATHEWVWGDPERIGQVLRNLLANAAKYSPACTPIEVRATLHRGRVRIAVADHGFGIHPDDVARI